MRLLICFICILLSTKGFSQDQESDIQAIENLIEKQRQDWNNYNLEGFMNGYWKNDSLQFYGSGGVVYGWKNTLDRYNNSYPSKDHTGHLKFKINSITPIEDQSYYVLGEYYLERKAGNANGIFMIILKKINGEWKIIADTSC